MQRTKELMYGPHFSQYMPPNMCLEPGEDGSVGKRLTVQALEPELGSPECIQKAVHIERHLKPKPSYQEARDGTRRSSEALELDRASYSGGNNQDTLPPSREKARTGSRFSIFTRELWQLLMCTHTHTPITHSQTKIRLKSLKDSFVCLFV